MILGDYVISQPSIKVIFREDFPNNLLFSEDPIERQILTQLSNRLALVINGATGEKYLIRTLEYSLDKFKNSYYYYNSLEKNISNNKLLKLFIFYIYLCF